MVPFIKESEMKIDCSVLGNCSCPGRQEQNEKKYYVNWNIRA